MPSALRALFVCCLILAPGIVGAEPETKEQKVGILSAEANMSALLLDLQIQNGSWSEAVATSNKGNADLDKRLDPALAAAKGHPDLIKAIKAIKEFYIAAKGYFDGAMGGSGTPAIVAAAQAARLKSELDAKSTALDLEIKTAHLKGK